MRSLGLVMAGLLAATATATATATPTATSTATPTAATAGTKEAGARAQARPKRFSSSLDKRRVTLGEAFSLTIEVTHAPADTYALPQKLTVGELALRGAPQTARHAEASGEATTVFTLPLVDLKTLTPRLPDLMLLVDGPEGPRTFTVPGQPLELVSLVEPDGKKSKEKGPRAPKKLVSIYIRSWLWAAVAAGALLFAAALYGAMILGRRAREARERASIPQPLAPDEEALSRIASLRARAPWDDGAARAAIFELSEIVRVYLGKRLGFDALDQTTDELLEALRRRRILGLDLAELTDDLSWEVLVKFARLEPTPDECVQACERAAQLVDRIRPHEAPPDAASGKEARA